MKPEERAAAWIDKYLVMPPLVRALTLRTLAKEIREAEQAATEREQK